MVWFKDTMTPEQLAKAKGQVADNDGTRRLAQAANGHGANSVQKARARQELVEQYGEKDANRLQEAEMQSAGARPRIFSRQRWLG